MGVEPAAGVGEVLLELGRAALHHRNLQGGEDPQEARQGHARHLGSTGHGDGSGAKQEEGKTGAQLDPGGDLRFGSANARLKKAPRRRDPSGASSLAYALGYRLTACILK